MSTSIPTRPFEGLIGRRRLLQAACLPLPTLLSGWANGQVVIKAPRLLLIAPSQLQALATVLKRDLDATGLARVVRVELRNELPNSSSAVPEGEDTHVLVLESTGDRATARWLDGREIVVSVGTGASLAMQAHRLADDICKQVFKTDTDFSACMFVAAQRPIAVDGRIGSQIFLVDSEAKNARALLPEYWAQIADLSCSPRRVNNAYQIAYVTTIDALKAPRVWMKPIRKNSLSYTVPMEGQTLTPSWSDSAKGLYMYFARIEGYNKVGFYRQRAGTTNASPERLNGINGFASPTPSRDGRYLYYVANPLGRPAIQRADLANGQIETVSHNATEPACSPVSDELVFVRGVSGGNELVLLDMATRTETVLVKSEHDIDHPRFSPKGAFVVFTRGTHLCRFALRTQTLTELGSISFGTHSWSRTTGLCWAPANESFENMSALI